MGRILEDAEKAFLKTCAAACEAAVENAAKEIKKDFRAKVFDKAVGDYYDDYEPYRTRYKPTGGLYHAFKVYTKTVKGKTIEVSYDWDFNRLPNYHSGSKFHKYGDEWISRYDEEFDWDSEDNGRPEKGWIFSNFMEGIHPRWMKDKELGYYDESMRFQPSYKRIKDYKDEYISNGDARDILIKHLQIQCKKFMK